MLATNTIAEEILDLKRNRKAILLAHHYQESEIQELADSIGDSLELARKAQQFEGDVIVFCGVWFMAETAKVLNPDRIVVVPDREAGCSLVDSCPVDQLRAWKQRHPDHAVVSYINTSVEVKAESDILCTSRNAVQVVNSIPPSQPILFLPDINLGNYVKQQTGRQNMKIWQGACIVHATFPARRVTSAKLEHPTALVAAHPECPADVLRLADFIGSTSAIIDWCVKHPHNEFVVMTESGVRHSLERLAPEKKFYFVANEQCNCSECPYMKRNTLEKVRDCMRDLTPRVELTADLMEKARQPVERMLALR
ncbi:quinolinate synthase NadA [uncultured Paludibaculum sp.]|uniref:quinolinate synthase NadA n=1 Tax=uncultured Paludibaculum sp. TaxID=1765020 RepID=UPI002AAB9C7B|nr:quinolinate synthase NadA [uncultured Paludibaculum sp.]